ncbi:MAG: hypothetical protein JJT75_07775 [Opitutales bacterium]|nr:hypothetical protein [Opitutales bacterium]MCH8539439.1 hypothetical protein [Opitutales bacterium]
MSLETLFPLLIGLAMIAAPLFLLPEWRRARRRSEITMGRVVAHEEKTVTTQMGGEITGRAKTDHAKITFEVEGQPYTFVASEGASWKIHEPDTEQWICYDPEDPHNADTLPGPLTKVYHLVGFIALPLTGLVILIRTLAS